MSRPEFDLGNSAPFVASAPPRRNYIGWALLILFFAVYVPRATYHAVTREPSVSKVPATSEMVLKNSMAMREALRSFAPPGQPPDKLVSLEDTANSLAAPARTDPEAAAMYVAIRTEQDRKYDQAYLDVLRKSKDDPYKAFAEVYGADKLTLDQAQQLRSRLKGERFLYRLARAQALVRAGHPEAVQAVAPASLGFGIMIGALVGAAVLLLGLVLWVVFLNFRSQGRLKPLGHPAGILTTYAADMFAVRAAQLIAIFIFIPTILHALRLPLSEAAQGLLSGTLVIAGTLGVMGIKSGDVWISLKTLGIDARDFAHRLLWAIGGYVANVPAVFLTAILGVSLFRFLPAPEHPATEMLQKTHDPWAVISLLFLACVQAPVFEEILFRGILFPALSTVLRGPVAGAVASSLLFASLHPQGPALWLALATVGAMNCFLTYQTKSLIPAMILHAVHNGVLMLITLTLF